MSRKRFPQISYDKESEVLSIEIGNEKSVDSNVQGNVVIDYGKNDKVVRANLYKFNFDAFRKNIAALKHFSEAAKISLSLR